jgi:tRNA pseudouridine55 synthase
MVRALKKLYPSEKIGHAGSLDPFATGVLILLLGRATRLSDALLHTDKRYLATLKLGVETDSLDLTGKTTRLADIPKLTTNQVDKTLKSFEGTWEQLPPMYSAKKIKGVRLYKLARENKEVPRERVPVQLHELKLVNLSENEIQFEVFCSKGTYIRSLGQELAEKLGTVGHLTALTRLACGDFELGQSVSLEQVQKEPEEKRSEGYELFLRAQMGYRRILPRTNNNGNTLALNIV